MQLKTTDFVFDLETHNESQHTEIYVYKEIRGGDIEHGKGSLLLHNELGFVEALQKMIKWAYTEAF